MRSEKILEFYKNFRRKIAFNKKLNGKKGQGVGFLIRYLAILPDLFYVGVRLLLDKAVPMSNKIALLAGIIYLISPIDLIPDPITGIGWIDDLLVVAVIINRMYLSKNKVLQKAVSKYWAGDKNTLNKLKGLFPLLDQVIDLMPKRIEKVLRVLFPKAAQQLS